MGWGEEETLTQKKKKKERKKRKMRQRSETRSFAYRNTSSVAVLHLQLGRLLTTAAPSTTAYNTSIICVFKRDAIMSDHNQRIVILTAINPLQTTISIVE